MSTNLWIATTNAWATGANWSLGAAPVSTNAVIFQASAQSVAATDQSAVLAASLNVYDSFTGQIPDTADAYVKLGMAASNAVANFGVSDGGNFNGSSRQNWDLGSNPVLVTIYSTRGTGADAYRTPLRLLGTALTIVQQAGSASVAQAVGESATLKNLTIRGGSMLLGSGVSFDAACVLSILGGTVTNKSTGAILAVTVNGGALISSGTGTITTLTINARGAAAFNAAVTITNLVVFGRLDLSQGSGAVTVTNQALFYAGADIFDPMGRLVFSAGFKAVDCSVDDWKRINLGANRSYTVT